MKYLLIILITLLTLSCSLDRTNPLDPEVSNIHAPLKVYGITVTVTANNTTQISWSAMINIDGYYIYKSQSYNGYYKMIKDESDITADLYEDTDVDIPGSFYWYKMSAYVIVNGEKLEGYRSEPKTWN
ncbi:MAG: hypothetical protein K9N07_02820 [Candidatus Cloacimonetes bacterium]|nr:hypothetical protein [Candidatus Cloacimonadota bacterium]